MCPADDEEFETDELLPDTWYEFRIVTLDWRLNPSHYSSIARAKTPAH